MPDGPSLTLSAPNLLGMIWGGVLWLCAFGGGLARAHRTVPFWRPTALALSAFNATGLIAFFYFVFYFRTDLDAAGLPRWACYLVVGVAIATLFLVGAWINKAVPTLGELQSRIEADTDKAFAGERYPDKPLDFTANGGA
jgi:hypothetical protein